MKIIDSRQAPLAAKLTHGRKALARLSAAEHVPISHFVDDRTIATRDGALMQIIKLEGMPFDTRDFDELEASKRGRQNTFRILADPKFALWFTIVRREVREYPGGTFEGSFAAALDEQWQARWKRRRFFTNDIYVTLVRRPDDASKGLRAFLSSLRSKAAHTDLQRRFDRAREALANKATELVGGLRGYRPEVLTLSAKNGVLMAPHLSFLGYLINGEWRDISAPCGELSDFVHWNPVDFSASEQISTRTAEGKRYTAMLGIREYPPGTSAGMLDALLALPTELVVTQSFRFDPRDAAVEEMRRQSARYELVEDAAVSLQEELPEAQDRVASRMMAWGKHHLSVAVSSMSPAELKQSVADAMAECNGLGLTMVREGLGCEPAFWAQIPGNVKYITRSGGISTENLAGFASFHSYPRGKVAGNHWGPAITALETTAGTPYFFSFHYEDAGNTVVIGRSGSGKTVTSGFLLSQAHRIDGFGGFVFDKDRANEPCVRALNGVYTIVRAGERTGWNPFALPDTPANRAVLKDLMQIMATSDGRPLGARDVQDIANAVDETYRLDPAVRRIGEACSFLSYAGAEGESLAARMAPWHGDGSRAWLFDNELDTLELGGRLSGFDMTTILSDQVLSQPALAYLFHRVSNALSGNPTMIYIDEGWHFLEHPIFEKRISDWLRTIRKRNGIFVLVTQSAGDALRSRIGRLLIEQCQTHIFFPIRTGSREDYVDGWKLTEREFQTLSEMGDTARAFLVRRPDGSVLVRMDLGDMPEAVAVLSARTTSLEVLDQVREEVGDSYEDWREPFLRGVLS